MKENFSNLFSEEQDELPTTFPVAQQIDWILRNSGHGRPQQDVRPQGLPTNAIGKLDLPLRLSQQLRIGQRSLDPGIRKHCHRSGATSGQRFVEVPSFGPLDFSCRLQRVQTVVQQFRQHREAGFAFQ